MTPELPSKKVERTGHRPIRIVGKDAHGLKASSEPVSVAEVGNDIYARPMSKAVQHALVGSSLSALRR